jgi:hypothetical protein
MRYQTVYAVRTLTRCVATGREDEVWFYPNVVEIMEQSVSALVKHLTSIQHRIPFALHFDQIVGHVRLPSGREVKVLGGPWTETVNPMTLERTVTHVFAHEAFRIEEVS